MPIRIKIIGAHTAEEHPPLIDFETAHGKGKGLWMGPSPDPGTRHDVEFEFPQTFIWGVNVNPSTEARCLLEARNDLLHLHGRVVALEHDVLTIEFAGSVVLLDVKQVPSGVSGMIELASECLHLYPFHL